MAGEPQGLDEFLASSPTPAAAPVLASRSSAPASATPPGLDEFISEGLNQQKYGTTSQQIQAGLEGIARGASFGTSDYLARKLGDKPEDIRGRAEANPVTSNVGQLAGGAGLLYLTGGAASPIEGALESVAVPGLAAKAIGMGVEGAAFGAGNVISDAALGDPNLTGQKVLADVGMGFALGSGLGLLSHGVEAALPAATKKLSSALGNLKETVFGTEENPSLVTRALSVPGGVASGTSPADWASSLFRGFNESDSVAAVKGFAKNFQEVFSSAEKAADELGPAIEKSGAETEMYDPFSKKMVPRPEVSVGTERANFDPITKQPLPPIEAGEIASAPGQEVFQDYKMAAENFQKSFMKNGEVDSKKVESFFRNFSDPADALRREHLNDFVTKTQALAKASENYFGFEDAENSISKHVSELAKKQSELKEVADALKAKVKTSSGGSSLLGDLGLGYTAHALGVPNPVTGAAVATLEAYKAIRNPYEMGANLAQTFNKLKVLGEMSQSVGNTISKLSKGIFAGPAERSGTIPLLSAFSAKSYEKRVGRIEQLFANPEFLMKHLVNNTDALYEAAPNVSQSIQTAMVSGVQFLNSKIPRPTTEMPFSGKWKPSRGAISQFQKYYRAVDDPVSVLKDVKDGTLSSQSMEALQAVHPHLLDEMRKTVMENMDPKRAKNLSYATKIAIGKFLGQPIDEAMTPQAIASNQASLSGPQLGNQVAPKSGRSTQAGSKNLALASRAATETRDEAGEKG